MKKVSIKGRAIIYLTVNKVVTVSDEEAANIVAAVKDRDFEKQDFFIEEHIGNVMENPEELDFEDIKITVVE